MKPGEAAPSLLALAAVLFFTSTASTAPPSSRAWHSAGRAVSPFRLTVGKTATDASVEALSRNDYRISIGDDACTITIIETSEGRVRYEIGGHRRTARFAFSGATLHIDAGGGAVAVRDSLFDARSGRDAESTGELRAPMNGRIVAVHAKTGDTVKRGQRLVVLEAMKMQHEITAGRDGKVATVSVAEGDQVATRQLLIALEAAANGA